MFSSAFQDYKVNNIEGHKIYAQLELFRESIDQFRFKLLSYASDIDDARKVDDIRRWTQESGSVWASLTETDGLKNAKDLRGQIELRETIDAVLKFGRIMSQATLFDQDENNLVENPLLKNCKVVDEHLELYRKIPVELRFFKQISDSVITNSIEAFKEEGNYKPLDDP